MRRALIETDIEYKCNNCSINKWNNLDLILEVHHKDGNWKNNTKDNLELLCPNCHSLTPNFYNKKETHYCICGNKRFKTAHCCIRCAGIQKRKCKRPSKEMLKELVWKLPTTEIAIKYNVSDKAVEKWCKKYSIQKPGRGYWMKIKQSQNAQ